MFKGKTLLITGGTGSFGNAVLNRFLDTDIAQIRIFSRDEKKQDDMRNQYKKQLSPNTKSRKVQTFRDSLQSFTILLKQHRLL